MGIWRCDIEASDPLAGINGALLFYPKGAAGEERLYAMDGDNTVLRILDDAYLEAYLQALTVPLIPNADNALDLGSAAKTFNDLFIKGSVKHGTPVSTLIAGSTSFAIRDSTDSFNNLLVSEAGNATVRNNLTVTGNASIDGTTFGVDNINHRVGIGTSGPTTTLHVAGDALVTGNTTLGDAAGDTVTVPGVLNVTTGFAVDTSVLVVDTFNNRVGINNAAPTVGLDVTGAVHVSDALDCYGNATLGNASTDAHTINGQLTLTHQPRAYVSRAQASGVQSIAANTETIIDFTAENFTPVGITHSPTTRLTVLTAGTYRISAGANFNLAGAGQIRECFLYLKKNGSSSFLAEAHTPIHEDNGGNVTMAGRLVVLAANDYLEIVAYINGQSGNVEANNLGETYVRTYFMVERVY